MKKIIVVLATFCLMISACQMRTEYAAEGTFETTEVTISAEANGKILSLEIEEGDKVEAGQVIGMVDTSALVLQRQQIVAGKRATLSGRPQVETQLAAVSQQIANFEREKGRVERLLQYGAATSKQLDEINYQIATLSKQRESLRSQLNTQTTALNTQAEVADAQIDIIDDQLRKSRISSAVSGVVLAKYAEAGEVTAIGRPLFKVADLNKVYLRAYFTSDQLASIQLGQKVSVVADFGADNTQEYEGVISSIATQSEFTPKTIQTKDSRANLVYAVKIAVKNDGYIKLGMCGKVIL